MAALYPVKGLHQNLTSFLLFYLFFAFITILVTKPLQKPFFLPENKILEMGFWIKVFL